MIKGKIEKSINKAPDGALGSYENMRNLNEYVKEIILVHHFQF